MQLQPGSTDGACKWRARGKNELFSTKQPAFMVRGLGGDGPRRATWNPILPCKRDKIKNGPLAATYNAALHKLIEVKRGAADARSARLQETKQRKDGNVASGRMLKMERVLHHLEVRQRWKDAEEASTTDQGEAALCGVEVGEEGEPALCGVGGEEGDCATCVMEESEEEEGWEAIMCCVEVGEVGEAAGMCVVDGSEECEAVMYSVEEGVVGEEGEAVAMTCDV